ncbi:hypothetical protein UCRPC4_g01111 [Phaeomoniella chlamydospora]|uniref:NACHT domain-containing protein n=1 Tax=Phaeomoniella chlamydospora TaxID=158046 RepID=A0A0G2EZ07_PHACM|nr:hypothetical protein UCRPC4_g01111 [Phaeomoniella chlamydospora]
MGSLSIRKGKPGRVEARNGTKRSVGTHEAAGVFDKQRHPETTMNTVMTTIEPCMDWVNTGFQFLADNASGTMVAPAKALAAATAYLIKAAQNVTADLDLIVDCFARIKDAVEQISILQDFVPNHEQFHVRLMNVFTSLLDFCGFATTYFEKFSRRRMYFKTLVSGRSEQISTRCTNVEKTIASFRETVPLSQLALQGELNEKVDDLPQHTVEALMRAVAQNNFDPQSLIPKNNALNKVREFFDLRGGSRSQADARRFRGLAGAYESVFMLSEYKRWHDGRESPFLWINGPSGCGKSYFMYSMIQRLQAEIQDDKNCLLAHFFFLTGQKESQSLRTALCKIIVQIAEQDAKLAQQIAKELPKNKSAKDYEQAVLWKDFMEDILQKALDGSGRTLYLLLDGLDQMDHASRYTLISRFGNFSGERPSIRVVFASDKSLLDDLKDHALNYETIQLADHNALELSLFIDKRYKDSPSLAKFPDKLKRKAKEILISKAQGIFAYIDVVLRRMEQIGPDTTASNLLDSLRPGTEGLYRYMTETLTSGLGGSQLTNVKTFYKWLVFGNRSLTIAELELLVGLDNGPNDFDIQKEVDGIRSSSVLYCEKRANTTRFEAALAQAPGTLPLNVNESGKITEDLNDTFVDFRQPSFKDFLLNLKEKTDLIPDPNLAKVEIFTLLCEVIYGAKRISPTSRANLRNYAVSNFKHHLMEIDMDTANKDQTTKVVEGLARVLKNEDDTTRIIEAVARENRLSIYDQSRFDLYEQFAYSTYKDRTPRQTISAWASKVQYHGGEELSRKAVKWVKDTVRSNGSHLLVPLIAGHVKNWHEKVSVDDAWPCYQLICQATLDAELVRRSKDSLFFWWRPTISQETIDLLKQILAKRKRIMVITPRARIAIALLASSDRFSDANPEYSRQLYEENLNQTLSGAERFYTHLGLAEYYMQKEDYEQAAMHGGVALQQHECEKHPLGSDLDSGRLKQAFSIQASALQKLGPEHELEAVTVYENGLETLGYATSLTDFLDSIVAILSSKSDHLGIIRRVKNWPSELRTAWIGNRTWESMWKQREFRKAVILTRRPDLLIRYYEEAIESFKLLPNEAFIRFELAIFYIFDLRVPQLGKSILSDLLKERKAGKTYEGADYVYETIVADARSVLLETLCEEFCTKPDMKPKKAIMGEVRQLYDDLKSIPVLDNVLYDAHFAHFELSLAKMSLDMGSTWDTRKYATTAFKLCVDDLEDHIGGNDSPAFRILGKILAFAGLTVDARIALSLQLSSVDEKYVDRDDGVSSRSSDSGSDTDSDSESSIHSDEVDDEDVQSVIEADGVTKTNGVAHDEAESRKATQAKTVDVEEATTVPNGEKKEPVTDISTPPAPRTSTTETTNAEKTEEEPSQKPISNGVDDVETPNSFSEDAAAPGETAKKRQNDTSPPSKIIESVPPSPTAKLERSVEPGAVAPEMNGEARTEEKGKEKHNGKPTTTTAAATAAAEKTPELPAEDEENKTSEYDEGSSISCSGDCAFKWYYTWTTTNEPNLPIYRCLGCRDTDLCQSCFDVQKEYTNGTGEGFWGLVCPGGPEHEYIRQPIEGWLGVKSGVIYMEGSDQKTFRDWLDSVKKRFAIVNWRSLVATKMQLKEVKGGALIGIGVSKEEEGEGEGEAGGEVVGKEVEEKKDA